MRTQTIEQIVTLRLQGHTYSEIAKRNGVSRQRIQQLIAPPKAIRIYILRKFNHLCANCDTPLTTKTAHLHHLHPQTDYNDIDNLRPLCQICHRQEHNSGIHIHSCAVCGKITKNKFCSQVCKQTYYKIPIKCSQCDNTFYRYRFLVTRAHGRPMFCSKTCWGRWFGKHHGFGHYPSNRGHRKSSDQSPKGKSEQPETKSN